MKTLVLSVLSSIFLVSCNQYLTETHKSNDCKDFYTLIKKDWENKGGYYQIKGDPPYLDEGKYRLKYFSEKCLIDLPAKKLVKVLGKPNREPPKEGWKLYEYCMNQDCTHKFQVILDSLSFVRSATLNPEERTKD